MEIVFIKNLAFPSFPLTYIYIHHDYNSAKTIEALIDVCFKWINLSETTKNIVAKNAYISASNALYNELTNKSYETKKYNYA